MKPLTIFVPTTGEPITLECVARLRKFTPVEHDLVVWYDTCGRKVSSGLYSGLLEYTDDIVLLTRNHGLAESLGFALLYLHTEHILVNFADCLVQENYWDRLWKPFRYEERMACSGQANFNFQNIDYEVSNRNNYPDHTQLYSREAINEIGGICPSFRTYGHDPLEFHYRTLERGWNYAACKNIIHFDKESSAGRDQLQDKEKVIGRNINVFEKALSMNFKDYNWWTNDLLEEKEKVYDNASAAL